MDKTKHRMPIFTDIIDYCRGSVSRGKLPAVICPEKEPSLVPPAGSLHMAQPCPVGIKCQPGIITHKPYIHCMPLIYGIDKRKKFRGFTTVGHNTYLWQCIDMIDKDDIHT